MKNGICAAICFALFALFALFAVCLRLAMPIWLLFLAFAIYFSYASLRKPRPRAKADLKGLPLGKLDRYSVDGDLRDLSYGLVLELMGEHVFVDLKEDALLDERRMAAMRLYDGRPDLERSLATFFERNADFRGRRVESIGLHSDDLSQAEVFWDPEGYTLLRGLRFCDATET